MFFAPADIVLLPKICYVCTIPSATDRTMRTEIPEGERLQTKVLTLKNMKDTVYTQLGDIITTAGDSITLFICENATHDAAHTPDTFSSLLCRISEFLPGSALFVAAIFLALLIFSLPVISKWISNSTHLLCVAVVVLICGFLLYLDGFNSEGCKDNLVALAARASISALEMFASHSDLIEVRHELHEDKAYMLAFSLVHFSAVVVSALFVINLFGLRFRNWRRRMSWHWKDCGRNKLTYIFWGINEEALALAKNIQNKQNNANQPGNAKCRIVFVLPKADDPHGHEHSGQHFSFSKLFGFALSFKAKIEDIMTNHNGCILKYKTAGSLNKIKFLLKDKVRVLFLSNDEDKNLEDLFSIKGLPVFEKSDVEFYCHAQKNLLNERLAFCQEDKQEKNDKKIKLVDSSYLSALELKHNPEAHPVNFVDIETAGGKKTGRVNSKFTALVLGFGDTGQEALSFLYEFSAFVGQDNEQRSPYRLVTMDRNMTNLYGNFVARRPAIGNNENLQFICTDVNTREYWMQIDELVAEGLNYVIVALGDDKLNLSTAIMLQEYVMRKTDREGNRVKLDHFCIYVKQRQEIGKDIEHLYGKEMWRIRTFGLDKNIFTDDIVLNDRYKKSANEFKEQYGKLNKGNNYEDCDDRVKEIDSPSPKKSPLEKIRKQEKDDSQNLSNAYHIYTKIQLMGEERIPELKTYKRYPLSVKDFTGEYRYQKDDHTQPDREITELMTTLAKCEHLRWNAALEMMGYTQNKEDRSACNLKTMEHNCLTSWDDLGAIWKELKGKKQYCEYKQYDFSVVETSIQLFPGIHKDTQQKECRLSQSKCSRQR